ncbi:MAG: hypothetical protein DM484_24440 [Candidatus Methylumidiphilus alinenensis]|uniref:TIR domain-containing protein n=1 Tax=Candidatus Methylumidiphilus alinenensis TaxID=2202197 RepID=A0A2W4SG47_9GAMM|nr:MAG: hypothetical protein DM484_24440 [Candidatus Methylumidiphilus alinenensis]
MGQEDMQVNYDVFLSYHSRDIARVSALAKKLQDYHDLKVFFDRWNLTPGQTWFRTLEHALSACGAVAVCVGPGEMGPWQLREVYSALDRQARQNSFPVIPVLLPGAEPPLGFLGQNTWVDFRSGLADEMSLHILAAGIRGEPPDALFRERQLETLTSICPYKGLQVFREEDAAFFFGRDNAIATLVQTLRSHQFVALVGSSGRGKSSVVRAGLVPKLRGEILEPWEIVTMVPSDLPFHHLAAGLLPLLETNLSEIDRLNQTRELAHKLKERDIELRDVIKRILEKQAGTRRFLLVVDQWEELYTYGGEDGTTVATEFINQLLRATTSGPLTVLLTLRVDFLGYAIGYRPLSDRLQGAQVNLGPMNIDELREAVTKPVTQLPVAFECGLADRIIHDVEGRPGDLPLLEFLLKRLWDVKPARILRHQDCKYSANPYPKITGSAHF